MSAVPAAVPSAWLLLVLSGSDFDIQYRMSEIIMMGTGVSGTVPRLNCIMKNPMDCNTCIRAQRALHPELADKWSIYADSHPVHDDDYKNVRGNVQMALKIPHPDGRPRVLVIDCGKSSRTAMFKYFPTHNISYVDAFLLTHDHADAILGLDDIRDIPAHDARMDLPKETDLQNRVGVAVKMPIYVMQQHFEAIRTAFPYLCKGLVKTVSHVPNIEWNCFDKEQPSLCIHDHIHIEVLPVWHGENYMCSGFAFGGINGTERLVYLSDVSEIPDQTWDRILCKPTDVLILDCLRHAPDHPTHITSEQALNIIRRIRPTQKTLLVGMLCVMEHTRSNDWLAQFKESEGLDVELAFDGQMFKMNLY